MCKQSKKDWEFVDRNGHLHLNCTHHDGTNEVQFYKLTKKGAENFHNWEYNSYGPWARFSEKEVHELMIRNHYARLPHFADAEFGKEVA